MLYMWIFKEKQQTKHRFTARISDATVVERRIHGVSSSEIMCFSRICTSARLMSEPSSRGSGAMQQTFLSDRIQSGSFLPTHRNPTWLFLLDRPIDWLTDWLIYWLIDRLIDRLIDWLIDWSIDKSIDWLIDWLIFRFIRLIDWLVYLFHLLNYVTPTFVRSKNWYFSILIVIFE